MSDRPVTAWTYEEEARSLGGISLRHLRDLVAQHNVPVLRAGGRVLFDEGAR